MLFLAALLPVTVFAHGHGHDRLIRRHAHLEKRAPLNCTTYDYQTPASLSAGSLNSTQGCGATYTAAAGDSCYSIIANSNSSFTLDTFLLVNPQLDSQCFNLAVGASYCTATSPCVARGVLPAGNCTSYSRASFNETNRSFAVANNVTFNILRTLNPNVTDVQTGRYYCISNGTEIAPLASTTSDDSKLESATPAQDQPETTQHLGEEPVAVPIEDSPATTQQPVQQPVQQKKVAETSPPKPDPKPAVKPAPQEPEEPQAAPKPKAQPQPQPQKQDDGPQSDGSGNNNGNGNDGGSKGVTMSGDATYFDVGLGSCGWTNSNSELVAAAAAPLYDLLGNDICGKSITLNRNGKSVTVRIVDKCPPCTVGSIDLSPTAFAKIADMSEGRVQMSWDASSLGSAAVQLLAQAGL